MEADKTYDVAIVGGGLAGLALSIQLKRQGHTVILFEKEHYPLHKICGEYISLESWDFLNDLGVDLERMKVSIITKLQVSSVNGKMLEQSLPQGGFGISRYKLDHTLVQIAMAEGVDVMEKTKVNDIEFSGDEFTIHTSIKQYRSKLVAGSYGKRSNMDIKWKRPFISATKNKLNNYIGVKYHIKSDFSADTVALHNFKNGYCGIVKIEDDNYNICYLTTASNLQNSNGDIKQMEQTILSENSHLKKIITESNITSLAPLTISQISFDKKSQVENHVLMVGDAAGMITPLCGNGMSMALHGSKIAATFMHKFLEQIITRTEMENQYSRQWKVEFAHRLRIGRRIQQLFGVNWLTNLFISIVKPFPGLVRYLVRQTHGKPF